jgi:mannose-6-phosphate isomerase-like protein (cupin superfamily)
MPVLFKNQGNTKEIVPGIEARVISMDSLMTLVSEIYFGIQLNPPSMHTHKAEQTTYILEGELTVFIEGEESVRLSPGDLCFVPSGVPHAIQSHSERIRVVESFSPPRQEFITN